MHLLPLIDGDKYLGQELKYTHQEPIKVKICEGFYIVLMDNLESIENNNCKLSVRQKNIVVLLFDKPQTLEYIRRKQLIFIWLINFATGKLQKTFERQHITSANLC